MRSKGSKNVNDFTLSRSTMRDTLITMMSESRSVVADDVILIAMNSVQSQEIDELLNEDESFVEGSLFGGMKAVFAEAFRRFNSKLIKRGQMGMAAWSGFNLLLSSVVSLLRRPYQIGEPEPYKRLQWFYRVPRFSHQYGRVVSTIVRWDDMTPEERYSKEYDDHVAHIKGEQEHVDAMHLYRALHNELKPEEKPQPRPRRPLPPSMMNDPAPKSPRPPTIH